MRIEYCLHSMLRALETLLILHFFMISLKVGMGMLFSNKFNVSVVLFQHAYLNICIIGKTSDMCTRLSWNVFRVFMTDFYVQFLSFSFFIFQFLCVRFTRVRDRASYRSHKTTWKPGGILKHQLIEISVTEVAANISRNCVRRQKTVPSIINRLFVKPRPQNLCPVRVQLE